MHDDRERVEARLRRMVLERVEPARICARVPLEVARWDVPGEPVGVAEAMAARFGPMEVGSSFGKPWGTTWFTLAGAVPNEWAGGVVRAAIDLGFSNRPGFQSEGLFWTRTAEGWQPLRGLNPFNQELPLADSAPGGESVELVLEAASNPDLSVAVPNPASYLATAGSASLYRLSRAELVLVDPQVEALRHDVRALNGLMKQLDWGDPRRHEILRALETMLDRLDLADAASIARTAPAGRAELAAVLSAPATASAHRITAIGHAHIDTAWLWPLRETRRKCARTFTNQLALIERYPQHRFACSQALHYDWMREHYPTVFRDIGAAVAEGTWIPVGGMWVEADANLSGGEALIRQFTHGQRFFEEHFGVECTEGWLPDVFGYNANLPQILRHVGIERFVTQKLSWNTTNRFPHHSFWWEGIDGSTVFTHFPPVETYNANFSGHELAHAVRTFADKGRSTRSLMPFGHGDGGGGPTADMLEQFLRVRDLEGSPLVEIGAPSSMLDAAIEEYRDAPRWVGELYLEMHRGTYTSQAATKAGNRRCEALLREAEVWSVAAYGGDAGRGYPAAALDRLWKSLLTLQFHDILPGSSIGWVHREAQESYTSIELEATELIHSALTRLAPVVSEAIVANPTPFVVRAVVPVRGRAGTVEEWPLSLEPHGVSTRSQAMIDLEEVRATVEGSSIELDNAVVAVRIDAEGHVSSMVHHETGREVVAPGSVANVLQTFEDLPTHFDAWEIEDYTLRRPREQREVDSIEVLEAGPLVVRVEVRRSFGSSKVVQRYVLRAGSPRLDIECEVDWREHETLLKVAFPIDVHSTSLTREVQLGECSTPIHTNTSWDAARFEVCALRWVDCSEPGFGVALLNDSKHGHDVTRIVADGGDRPAVQLRLSLLRSSRYPDTEQDQGAHRFTYSLMPHDGDRHGAGVAAQAWLLNNTIREFGGEGGDPGQAEADPFVANGVAIASSSSCAVVIEAVKAADDGSGDVVVRCHESTGARGPVELCVGFVASAVQMVDGRERCASVSRHVRSDESSLRWESNGITTSVTFSILPFEIVTLRLRPRPT